MFITTDHLDPQRAEIVNAFEQHSPGVLPADYAEFVVKYGAGTFAGEVEIVYPNAEDIGATYKDYAHLWKLDRSFDAADLLTAVKLGASNDGDYLCAAPRAPGRVFILPRHSNRVKSFATFFAAAKSLLPKNCSEYFDPQYESRYEQIKLIKNSALIDIAPIHKAFLAECPYDFVTDKNTQPQYFMKNVGSVRFDLIYKNSITVRFQKPRRAEVQPTIDFLKARAV